MTRTGVPRSTLLPTAGCCLTIFSSAPSSLDLVHTPVVAGAYLTDECCFEEAPAEILNGLLFGRKLTTRTSGTKQGDLKIL